MYTGGGRGPQRVLPDLRLDRAVLLYEYVYDGPVVEVVLLVEVGVDLAPVKVEPLLELSGEELEDVVVLYPV